MASQRSPWSSVVLSRDRGCSRLMCLEGSWVDRLETTTWVLESTLCSGTLHRGNDDDRREAQYERKQKMGEAFTPPGPGFWQLDRSHFAGGTTPLIQPMVTEATEAAYRKAWKILGVPADTVSMRFVNGFTYTRLRPLVLPDKPSTKAPPTALIKLAARVHPEFRRRNRAAAAGLASSPAPAEIAKWHEEIRPRLVAENLAFQDVDLADLSNVDLADHLDRLVSHLMRTWEEHHRLHCYDLGPIGQLLHAGQGWGIPSGEMVAALGGASPSTSAPKEAVGRIAAGLRDAGVEPKTLDDVMSASPEVAAELTEYLRYQGSVLYSGYDIDTPTLGEAPRVVLATITAAGREDVHPTSTELSERVEATIAELRERVPASERSEFDELLSMARTAMDLRDDNGPITVEWPMGLMRLAMLHAGERLVAEGRLHEREHILEVDRGELDRIVRSGHGPSADTLAERAVDRAALRALDPPRTLGEPEATPPIDALPAPLAQIVETVGLVIAEMGVTNEHAVQGAPARLDGTGVGTEPFVGRARVSETAEAAFDVLEDGDILVTRATSPAYNLVLTLVGGLVTSEGGPMSHAAVLSRELGIPAIVGAPDAMTAIADGDIIEIDPQAGTVRVVTS